MANDKPLSEYLTEVAVALEGESVQTIDFDALISELRRASDLLASRQEAEQALAILRSDYVERISGMAKAVAITENRRDEQDALVELCESLTVLPVEQLLLQYRRVSARFRDAFPNSYGQLRLEAPSTSRRRSYAEYK